MKKRGLKKLVIPVTSLVVIIVVLASAFFFTMPINAGGNSAKGADISWIPQMEAKGYTWNNSSGVKTDIIQLLKDKGINAARIRVWVNPSTDPYNGCCNITQGVALAKRAVAKGMSIMLDFHYSDTWTDPAHQAKPAAWASLSFANLTAQVKSWTTSTINTFKSNGITPTWVQVGNETSDGMLWTDGKASTNMANYAALVNAGYDGVKAACSASVIIHLANGDNNTNARWLFDGLKTNNAKYDIIGFSLYPSTTDYASKNTATASNMADMVSRYGKQCMICEVGLDYSAGATAKTAIQDLKTKISSYSNGIFYWEPACYNWNSYVKGATDPSTKKLTAALDW